MPPTETALVELGPDGVLSVHIRTNAAQSVANAKENLSAALQVAAGQRRPLLVDISEAQPLSAEVRHYYSGQVLVSGFTALALLVHASQLGRMMGNVYFRIARPPADGASPEDHAAWARGYAQTALGTYPLVPVWILCLRVPRNAYPQVSDQDFGRNDLLFNVGTRWEFAKGLTLLLSVGRSLRDVDDDSPELTVYAGIQFNF